MPGRIRSRQEDHFLWAMDYYGYSYAGTQVGTYESCLDVTGNREGVNPLDIWKERTSGGQIFYTNGGVRLDAYPSGLYFPNVYPSEGPSFDPDSYVNRLLSSTGPITPRILLPVFIYELKDIPLMLRHAGDLLHKIVRPSGLNVAKEAAAANLAYKFGWAPLIQDMKKLLQFSELARKQQRLLKGAYSEKGIRRRVSELDSYAGTSGGSLPGFSSYGLYFDLPYTEDIKQKVWGSVRWIVRDPNLYGYEPSYNEALAMSLGLGLRYIPLEIWKVIPWSWMIDWFADISNILQATNNMVDFKPYNLCIMRETTNTRTSPRVPLPGGLLNYCSQGRVVTTWKRRAAYASPSPNFSLRLPFMDSYKLSVLGSLAILKTSSGRR